MVSALTVRLDQMPPVLMLTVLCMSVQNEILWRRAQQLQEENITIVGTVVGVNRGGLMVDYEHIRGFLPISHAPPVSLKLQEPPVDLKP